MESCSILPDGRLDQFRSAVLAPYEEKIAAIIDKKRELMDGVVQADDPKLAKIFTREELLEPV